MVRDIEDWEKNPDPVNMVVGSFVRGIVKGSFYFGLEGEVLQLVSDPDSYSTATYAIVDFNGNEHVHSPSFSSMPMPQEGIFVVDARKLEVIPRLSPTIIATRIFGRDNFFSSKRTRF